MVWDGEKAPLAGRHGDLVLQFSSHRSDEARYLNAVLLSDGL